MKSIERAIRRFSGVTWVLSGYPVEIADEPGTLDIGWVKFAVERSERGWNTLEFLAWVCDDMRNAGERIEFVPIAPPPYLNEAGNCLCFVLECHPEIVDSKRMFDKVAAFIDACRKQYWAASYGQPRADQSAAISAEG